LWQKSISEDQATQATRLENLRFVRQLSSESNVVARPLIYKARILRDLISKVRNSTARISRTHTLLGSDLSPTPATQATKLARQTSLAYANLTGATLWGTNLTRANLFDAHLTGAHLTGAHLDGVHCDEKTKWPDGFKPPPCG
jgi:uncharacterized protein YjbI with pentapeptide repeats